MGATSATLTLAPAKTLAAHRDFVTSNCFVSAKVLDSDDATGEPAKLLDLRRGMDTDFTWEVPGYPPWRRRIDDPAEL